MIAYVLCLIFVFDAIAKEWRQNEPILLFFVNYSTKCLSKISKSLSYLGNKKLPGLTDLGFPLNTWVQIEDVYHNTLIHMPSPELQSEKLLW